MASCAATTARAGDEPHGLVAPTIAGTFVGTLISSAWVLRDRAAHGPEDRWSDGTIALLMTAGAAAGTGIGLASGLWRRPSPGRALFTPTIALVSASALGLAAAALTANDERRDDVGFLTAAITSEAAVIAGSWLGRWLDPTVAQGLWTAAGAAGGAALLAQAARSITGDDVDAPAVLTTAAIGVLAGGVSAFLIASPRR